jgi:hypothetical protein
VSNTVEDKSVNRFANSEPTPYFGYAKPAYKSKLRLDQENEIMADLQTGEGILIRAFFRMGQTSMIRALENRFAPNAIHIDVRTLYQRPTIDLIELFNFAASHFLDKKGVQVHQQEALDSLSAYLTDKDETVLIAVNEGGAITNNSGHARFVSDLSHLAGVCLAVQMPYMAEHGESVITDMFKDFKTHNLRALRQNEVDMLTKGVATTLNSSATFTDGALDGLFELSGGRPWDVAASCEFFLRHEKLKTDFNDTDIQRLLEMNIANINETHLRGPIYSYERVYSQVLSVNQSNIVDVVRTDGIFFSDSQEEIRTAQTLVDASWFKFDQERAGYVFNGHLLTKTLTE